jgi:hypothetical protein
MSDDWRALLTEYEYAVDLLERASRTLTRALVTDSVPRDEIEALVDAEIAAREATASARLRLVNLWRATSSQPNHGINPPSSHVLEVLQRFSELNDEDRKLITRLIHLVAAAPRNVHDEVGQRLTAPPKPTTQAELRGRVEAVIAYLDCGERERA